MQKSKENLLTQLQTIHPETNSRFSWSDEGNGNLLADIYKDEFRFCPERNQWFFYDGRRWKLDIQGVHIMEAAKLLGEALIEYSGELGENEFSKAYQKCAEGWRKRHRRETLIKEAQSVYPVSYEEFDRHLNLFNCQNGTLDLNTRAFRKHDPNDLLTQIAGTDYDPNATCKRWDRFMKEITCDNQEQEIFLQKALGYTLSGEATQECFFMLYGATSRNGKGTLMETMMKMMGDYGKTASPLTITQQTGVRSGAPSEDIARLSGARFVNISEPDKRMTLSASLIKRLTGRDTIVARYLNEGSFEYIPQYTIFINTNHLPTVKDDTVFTSGRCHVIPFQRHFTPQEQDYRLKDLFAENLSTVLNYCLNGLWLIQETGFEVPDCIRDATRLYREDNDKIARFIHEMLEEDPESEIRSAEAYTCYKDWCALNGHQSGSITTFKSDMKRLVQVVDNKRPKTGGSPTTLIVGYHLKNHNIE